MQGRAKRSGRITLELWASAGEADSQGEIGEASWVTGEEAASAGLQSSRPWGKRGRGFYLGNMMFSCFFAFILSMFLLLLYIKLYSYRCQTHV